MYDLPPWEGEEVAEHLLIQTVGLRSSGRFDPRGLRFDFDRVEEVRPPLKQRLNRSRVRDPDAEGGKSSDIGRIHGR